MNGKFIILLMVSVNVISLLITAGYSTQNADSGVELGTNYIFDTFFTDIGTANLNNQTTIDFNTNTSAAIDGLDNEQSSGSFLETFTGGVSFILDTFRMIIGFLSILTPIPLLAFFSSLGFPLWIVLLLGSPIVILYVIAIVEFVGNRNL